LVLIKAFSRFYQNGLARVKGAVTAGRGGTVGGRKTGFKKSPNPREASNLDSKEVLSSGGQANEISLSVRANSSAGISNRHDGGQVVIHPPRLLARTKMFLEITIRTHGPMWSNRTFIFEPVCGPKIEKGLRPELTYSFRGSELLPPCPGLGLLFRTTSSFSGWPWLLCRGLADPAFGAGAFRACLFLPEHIDVSRPTTRRGHEGTKRRSESSSLPPSR